MALINSTFWSLSSLLVVVLHLMIHLSDHSVNGQPLVPAMFIFGDSVMDAGNNNNLHTVVKADFLPYGRDFLNHQPTGRFCNGKLAVDLIADTIGFTSYQPAYLSKDEAKGNNLLIGANFASASSGYYESTAKLYGAISLPHQLGYFEEYKTKLMEIAGISNTTTIISESVYFLSAGSSDFLQNYHINPFLYELYSPQQFVHILINNFCDFIQKLYDMGARKIGVTSLPPLGCVPAAITIFGHHSNDCVDKLNKDAIIFNNKLNATARHLQTQLHNLTLVVFDIYHPLYQLVSNPEDNGFAEARKACCGTGLLETSFLCNSKSPGTCKNATEYVFWDGFHPTEAANQLLSNSLIADGISLIS